MQVLITLMYCIVQRNKLPSLVPIYDSNVTIDGYLCSDCHCSLRQLLRLASKKNELELIEGLLRKQDSTNVSGTIKH